MKKSLRVSKSNTKPVQFHHRSGRVADTKLQITRVFDLQVKIPPHNKVVIEVLNAIENDQIMVFDERRQGQLNKSVNGSEDINLNSMMTRPVSIRKWLTAGCQVIRWDEGDEINSDKREQGVLGWYTNNTRQVLCPPGISHIPAGPGAIVGEIVLNRDKFQLISGEVALNQLKCVIAHELTHVFDALKLIVPAFINWRKCWKNVLEDGDACDDAQVLQGWQAVFPDNYGSTNELLTLKDYWPTHASVWFEALRSQPSANDDSSPKVK
jgi:hypothetical protein